MRQEEKNKEVKLAACNALFLALDFCKKNFENPTECSVIFEVVLAAMEYPDEDIRISAFAIMTEVASLHYDKLAPFMQRIFKITLESIQKGEDEEDLCKFGIEFWCTICDEELSIQDELEYAQETHLPTTRKNLFFVKGSLQFLIPLLVQCLVLQDDDYEPDEFTIPVAAAVCLTLIAQSVKDDIVMHVMPFVERNILHTDWKLREGAVLAFGCILEGPKTLIHQLISQAAPVLIKHLKDSSVAVKDTSAWTLGSILKLHHQAILGLSELLLKNLCEALGDASPRVSGKACYALYNFALVFQDEDQNPVGKHFVEVVRMLLLCADRPDTVRENLRSSAYEALNVVLDSAPKSVDELLAQITKVMIERLEKTFQMEILSQDDRNNINELQSLLCGVLQVLVTRLGRKIKPFSDPIVAQCIRIFRSKKDFACYEEGMLTVTAISQVVGVDFLKYMTDLLPHLLAGMSNWQAHQGCNIAIGAIGDIARAIGGNIFQFCDRIVTILLTNLQNRDLDRTVKITILSTFGDIALAIGGDFEKYLEIVLHMLKLASETVYKTKLPDDNFEAIESLNCLREGISEAYTGIIQGLKSDGKVEKLFQHVNTILQFVVHVATEKQCNETVKRESIGIVGDLALSFQGRVKSGVQSPQIQQLIIECQSTKDFSKETKETAIYARSVTNQL